MGAVVAVLLPGAPMPPERLRAELFHRYGLDWELGRPAGRGAARRDARDSDLPARLRRPERWRASAVVGLGLDVELAAAAPPRRGPVRRSSSFRTSKPLAMSLE